MKEKLYSELASEYTKLLLTSYEKDVIRSHFPG